MSSEPHVIKNNRRPPQVLALPAAHHASVGIPERAPRAAPPGAQRRNPVAREEGGRRGGRHRPGRTDDGAREGGFGHMRADYAPGRDPGPGGDAVYVGQTERAQAGAERLVGGPYTR